VSYYQTEDATPALRMLTIRYGLGFFVLIFIFTLEEKSFSAMI
jgi:hypothetical protein